MKKTTLLIVTALLAAYACVPSSAGEIPRNGHYYWLWFRNIGDAWPRFIDFAAGQKVDGVVIWGLDGWKEDNQVCRGVVAYAHERGVKVIHGFGLNGYHEGQHIVQMEPGHRITIPEAWQTTDRGKDSLKSVFCPSQDTALAELERMLLRTAETGVDGFNFETADVDYVTCHCAECQKRFNSADEKPYDNKPIEWPLFHLTFAADALLEKYPGLWLNCEYLMPRFGQAPYTDNERIIELNRRVDQRLTVVWADWPAPPPEICERLRKDRANIGFYVKSGAILGFDAKDVLNPWEFLPVAKRILSLDPVCIFYRSWLPEDYWAVNMATAARIMKNPDMSAEEVEALMVQFEKAYGFNREPLDPDLKKRWDQRTAKSQ